MRGEAERRWIGVGRSAWTAAHEAGREAARAAIAAREPKLLVVFCSDDYDLPALLAGIADERGAAALIGCTTAGEIATDGPEDAGVVVVALGGDGFSVSTAITHDASADLRGAGATAASAVAALPDVPHRALLLLTDGLGGDQQEIVRGAYSVLGAGVPLVGGCAGDGLKMSQTFQLHDDGSFSDSVVAAAIGSDAPIGIGVRHGWRPVGEPMLVTESDGNRVYKLDDQPALDVYLERLDAPPAAHTDPAAFTEFALTHPLGLNRRAGEEHVRFVGEANFEDRSLGCIARVPQGGLARFMQGDEESVLRATDAACAAALEPLGDRSALGFFAFDCIARRGILGDEGIKREIDQVVGHAAGAPVAGFYTYGEIARTRGISGFHNQTLVVLAFA